MLRMFWKSLLVSPAILGATLVASANASSFDPAKSTSVSTEFNNLEIAQVQDNAAGTGELLNQIEQYGNEGQVAPVQGNTIDQVTSVNQLRDVSPTAWAFEALRSLVERYGCIVGYPDRTFRGDRALTRWEFAAGLNACLNVMERLIQDGVNVLKEDLDALKRLMDEFQAELAALGARVDNLESRVSFLENNQFSTTTKLAGEVIFAVTDTVGAGSPASQAAMQYRARLLLNTSFTGQDVLKTRLAAGSATPFGFDYKSTTTLQNGDPASVRFDNLQSPSLFQTWTAAGNGSDVVLDWLAYYTPIDLGYFGRFNPGNGLFNGDYAALAQINANLFNFLNVGFTYVNAYQGADTAIFGNGGSFGVTGTSAANLSQTQLNTLLNVNGNDPDSVTLQDEVGFFNFGAKVSNSYGLTGAVDIGFASLSAFGSYSTVRLLGLGDAEVWTYGAGIAFPDLGKEGNILGLFAGAQPYIGHLSFRDMGLKVSNIVPYHVELFYKYQVTDNISITPGVIWISAPEQFKGTGNEWIGTLRGTFTF